MEENIGWLFFVGIIGIFWFIGWIIRIVNERDNAQFDMAELRSKNRELEDLVQQWEDYSATLKKQDKELTNRESLFKTLFKERTKNYPVVGQIWSDLISITEDERARALKYKRRPALKAAQEIQNIKREKRELVKEIIYWKYKAQNYEAIYPWLADELEQDIQDEVDAEIYYSVYTESEREDPVSQFLSPEDYRRLTISQRNQLAFDRYWQQGKKSKWMIGKMYERYVGYLYEKEGWEVDYFGIHKRFQDLGRDIIATKGNTVHVVQCKNWARFRTIYENHVFQLFGTAAGMQKDNPKQIVTPVFYCSTILSDTANEFAERLGIKVYQKYPLRSYPAIKCNISPNGEKIYHLPFDQQYDKVKITPKKGEFYAESVHQAEAQGFRRAFKWSGNKTQ